MLMRACKMDAIAEILESMGFLLTYCNLVKYLIEGSKVILLGIVRYQK